MPYVSIIFQSIIAIVLVITSSFESLITYVGFTLNLFTFLTVFGIFILRYKHKHVETSYKTFLYPITPLLFLLIILWILINIMINRPQESLFGLGTVVLGIIFYFLTNNKGNKKRQTISLKHQEN